MCRSPDQAGASSVGGDGTSAESGRRTWSRVCQILVSGPLLSNASMSPGSKWYWPRASIRGVGSQDRRMSPSQARSGLPSPGRTVKRPRVEQDGLIDLTGLIRMAQGIRRKVPDQGGLTFGAPNGPFIGALGAAMSDILGGHDRSLVYGHSRSDRLTGAPGGAAEIGGSPSLRLEGRPARPPRA